MVFSLNKKAKGEIYQKTVPVHKYVCKKKKHVGTDYLFWKIDNITVGSIIHFSMKYIHYSYLQKDNWYALYQFSIQYLFSNSWFVHIYKVFQGKSKKIPS